MFSAGSKCAEWLVIGFQKCAKVMKVEIIMELSGHFWRRIKGLGLFISVPLQRRLS